MQLIFKINLSGVSVSWNTLSWLYIQKALGCKQYNAVCKFHYSYSAVNSFSSGLELFCGA